MKGIHAKVAIVLACCLGYFAQNSNSEIKAADSLQDAVISASDHLAKTGWTGPNQKNRTPLLQAAILQPSTRQNGPLWNLARKACAGEKVENSPLLDTINLSRPVRYFREQPKQKELLVIQEGFCPQPLENVSFVAGHFIGNGEGYYYKVSPQGEGIMEAVHGYYDERSQRVAYEKITKVTPAIKQDFDGLMAILITKYGRDVQTTALSQ